MKVLAVSGSPRKGNTEWMINQLSADLNELGVETDLLLLRKADIRRCVGCLKCEDRRGLCQLKDDMNDIFPRLISADALVLASPVYFEMVSGLLKNFMDRTCPVWTKLKGKHLAGMAVAEEGIGQALQNIKRYGAVCSMRWIGGLTVLAKNPEDASHNPALTPRLKRLAAKIVRESQFPL